MKILLATDGSAHCKTMVKKFAQRTFAPNTKVRIVTAYERYPYMMNTYPMGVSSQYFMEANQSAQKTAQKSAEDAADILRKQNPKLSISAIAIEGSPKNVILNEAKKNHANLIVVGSHGRGMVTGFLLGSVSQSVALHAKCSVEIVRK